MVRVSDGTGGWQVTGYFVRPAR